MYIEPVKCPICKRTGRPGETDFQSDESNETIYCACGNAIKVNDFRDQSILSKNIFSRLSGTSNYRDHGSLEIQPGQAIQVNFRTPVDVVCRAFFSTQDGFLHLKETNLNNNGMLILSSGIDGMTYTGPIKTNWMIDGLIEIDKLPTWYVQFYSAISNSMNNMYKASLFDYAVSFEAFMEGFLSNVLEAKYGKKVSEFTLKKNWSIEERVKSVLELATGKRLSDRADVFQPWDEKVRQIRNQLFHGTPMNISKEMIEDAHSATYQAIRYIENEFR